MCFQRVVPFIAILSLMATSAFSAYVVAPEIQRECKDLQDRVKDQPTSAQTRFEYAVCLSSMGQVEESRKELKAVEKMDREFRHIALPIYLERYRQTPGDSRAAYLLGFVYYFNDKPEDALHYFSIVAKREPVGQMNAWALGYMAVIKGEQEEWEAAEKLCREALRIEPEAYGLHVALALALKGQGRYFAAIGAYTRALSYKSDAQ